MPLMSKKTLLPLLIAGGYIANEKAVSYEAYGRKVVAYIGVKDMATRAKLENYLAYELKQNPNREYFPGHPTVAVQVTYFKAWHWDE